MRAILIPSTIAICVLVVLWLAGIMYTVPEASLPVGQYGMNLDSFSIGARRWILAKKLKIAPDTGKRLTISISGRTFTLGPITVCFFTPANPNYYFTPDPDDRISFEKTHSWLSWPTPFQYSFMGAATTSWRRHSYSRLLWKKSSGAVLELIWRDKQGYYPRNGWTDGYLEIEPAIKITSSRFEEAAVRYVASKKGWSEKLFLIGGSFTIS